MKRYLVLVMVLLLSSARAAVTNVAWYHLGEADIGAISGATVTGMSLDSVGARHLNVIASPRYTNAVSSTAAFAANSSLAISFAGAPQYLTTAAMAMAVDNFGIEVWVRPSTADPGTFYIVCNGNPSFNGWSIVRNGGQFRAAYGMATIGSGTATPGVWTHLALVRDGGMGAFYVNGAVTGITGSFLNPPSDNFTVGGQPSAPPPSFFSGDIDEVRLFTFNPGQFSTNDLLLNAPNVRTLPATSLTINSATFNGTVYARVDPSGPPVSAWFEWGLGSYTSSSAPQTLGTGAIATNFSGTITGLTPGATYRYRAAAFVNGVAVFGTNRTFTVPGPEAVTLPAAVTNSTVTLNGSANPAGIDTSAWFEWGTTTNYGNTTAPQPIGAGTTFTNYSQVLTGVFGGVYYFRAVLSNSFAAAAGTNQLFNVPLFVNSGAALPGVYGGSAAWGDYDNDGRLDILLTGNTNSLIAQVWRNTGAGFSNINLGLPGVWSSAGAWADFDNDGRLDFAITGPTNVSDTDRGIFQIWRNIGTGFTNINATIPTVHAGSVSWGDFDNDGRPDILLSGVTSNNTYVSQVWWNTGNGFINIRTDFPGAAGAAAWTDYDNDGWLDILITGVTNTTGTAISQIWRNGGSGFRDRFSNVNIPFPGVQLSAMAWGDYDNDGRPDLLLTGLTTNSPITAISQIWRNTGAGFTNINLPLTGVMRGSVAWGDVDNDGRLDFLLTGTTTGDDRGVLSQLWRNTGSTFTNMNIPLPPLYNSAVAFGDYDNDGRLDLLLCGSYAFGAYTSVVLRNNFPISNAPPLPPSGLSITATGAVATLRWNSGADAQTPAAGLSYNIRIGTTPGGSDVLAPASDPVGLRRLPQLGNAQQGLTAAFTYTVGTPYYWSVQTIDGALAGSAFAPEANFKILSPQVSVAQAQATIQPAGDVNGDSIVDQNEFNGVLGSYLSTSPWLKMTNVAGLGGTNVTFALTNSIAGELSVEYSTNLAEWYFLGPALPRYLFTDTNALTEPHRYYRLRWP